MTTKSSALTFILAASVFWAPGAYAYNFIPTETEWQSWPSYCKARYITTNLGKTSRFARQHSAIDFSELDNWQSAGIRGVHHFCTGTIWLNRARSKLETEEKQGLLRHAHQETMFTYERSERTAPQFAKVAMQLATVTFEQGDSDAALQILENLLANQPNNSDAYAATAVILRKAGHLEQAKETLIQGNQATDGQSAEIIYILGLICLELGQIDSAVEYAKIAYDMGYPLPGLRAKLERLDKM